MFIIKSIYIFRRNIKMNQKYNIIYGRLAGKHKIVTYFGEEEHYYINADFISEYNFDNFDGDNAEGFQTFSAIFGEKDVKYEDLLMDQMYFLITARDNCVIHFEEVKDVYQYIEINVGEYPLEWFTAPQVSCEYPELPEP